jgi:hypothetical protein
MRRLLLGAVLALAMLPVPSADALPPIRIRVPHIDVPLPSNARPLSASDWEGASGRYYERLENAGGDEDLLAVQEAVGIADESRLRQAVRDCGEDGASGALEAQFEDDSSTGSTVGSAVGDCLTAQLPDSTPQPVIDRLSDYISSRVETAVDGADDTEPVRLSIAWPEAYAADTGGTTGTDYTGSGSGGSIPWVPIGAGAAAVLLVLMLVARRRA